MRTMIFLFAVVMLTGCTGEGDKSLTSWPGESNVSITWQLMDDAVEGDNKQTSSFTISNQGDTHISSGWNLYFNQFPTTFYIPAQAEDLYDIESMGGDLYRIVALDSFPDILPGSSEKINYQWPVGMINKTHTPHGLFFVLRDGSVHNITNYIQQPFPQTLSFSTPNGNEPLHISSEKRYTENEELTEIPISQLSPILPTPRDIQYKNGNYPLRSGVRIYYDEGLQNEATNLGELLNQVLQNPVSLSESNSGFENGIHLKISGSDIISNKEGYRLDITSQTITITGQDKPGVFYGVQSLKALIPPSYLRVPADEILLPTITINDAPRYAYRGQHLDVARNFQPVEEIKKILRVMAFYKLNKMHFHLTDDEGWRLEIPDLPELTEVGARRGYSAEANKMLPPAYGSGGIAGEDIGTGTGFYTRVEFIDILKFAYAHHIEVIPEINGPGHARAAIRAMEARYQKLMAEGKESDARAYLLSDRNDASKYSSAQNYDDNVICVCQEYSYTFLEKVISEVVAMYKEAEAPLNLIHTGGDEVPSGAWTGSPECARLIRDEPGLRSVADLHPYFVVRYLNIASKFDLKIAGWEEITLRHTLDGNVPNTDLLNKGIVSYPWNAIIGGGGEDMAYQLANAGYEVVMCNASNLYFDLAYTYEPEEPGLFWAGYVDTKNAFELTPSNIFLSILEDEKGNPLDGLALARERVPLRPDAEKNILGIQGALWSETLKSSEMVEYSLLPKMLGLAERAWASAPAWISRQNRQGIETSIQREWTKFTNRLGKIELPRLDYMHGGYLYRISPPGAKIMNGKLYINSEYPGLKLRYTLDGTEPGPGSPLYTEPVEVQNPDIVKISAFNSNDRASRIVEIRRKEPN